MNYFHLDLETYSEANIKKVGLDNYAHHPSTEITMVSCASDQDSVFQTDEETHFLDIIRRAAADPSVTFVAFNAQFERTLLREVAGIDIPPERWRCVMVWAYSLGFTGGLDAIGEQMGLPQDKKKLKEGHRLVLKFSGPAPRNHKVDRYTKENAPEDWGKFCEYNRQDTVAEREIFTLLQRYPMLPEEWKTYAIDQHINDRGLPIDLGLVDKALHVYRTEKIHLTQELRKLTDLENPNSRDQLLGWLKDCGVFLPDIKAETLEKTIKEWPPWNPDYLLDVLKFRQQTARTAGTKWQAFKDRTDIDTGRLRSAFQFNGAARTARWAGRGIQPHNLHRSPEDQAEKVSSLLSGHREWVELMHGNTMDVVASCIRSGITAPPGKKLVVCDLSSIESRWLGWMADCKRINRIFAEGRDTYRDFASHWFNVPYDEVTKEQRTLAKPPELGCGYMLGVDGLVRYAEDMGVAMTKREAVSAVQLWRTLDPEVVTMWEWLNDAVKEVTQSGTQQYSDYGVTISRDNQFLFINLPSGRQLAYYQPQVQPRTITVEDAETGEKRKFDTISFTYMGMNSFNHQWQRLSSHGGKITENIDQAGCRDILRDAILKAENCPLFEVVGHVHDEIICLADKVLADETLKALIEIMSTTPDWAPGLKLGAAGYIADRYRKE